MQNQFPPLTQTVQKGGCAAKVAASELKKILSQVKFPQAHAQLLVDAHLFDDAAIYKVTDEVALVQTLDFFTPILDTPKLFGQVAAVNALSDVYAMGGKPKTCLGILAFPLMTLPEAMIVEIMQGACDKIAEAGANLVGGHSIDDDTLKFGLAVTGYVHPQKIWTNAGAKLGDHLILTKALGTGTLTAGLKRQALKESDIIEATESMVQLNNVIDQLIEDELMAVHAATDVTGFGLSGHSMQMALASGVKFKFETEALPFFAKSYSCLEQGFLTKAHRTNSEYTAAQIDVSALTPLQQLLIHDPQTSGGLLLAVSPEKSKAIRDKLKIVFKQVAVVGVVEEMLKTDKQSLIFT
jgi:selenide,water dikinase